jgi:hypothetical protein
MRVDGHRNSAEDDASIAGMVCHSGAIYLLISLHDETKTATVIEH